MFPQTSLGFTIGQFHGSAAQDLLKALVSEGQVSHEMGSVINSGCGFHIKWRCLEDWSSKKGRTIASFCFFFNIVIMRYQTLNFCMNFVFLSHIHGCHDPGLSISTHLEYDEPPKQTPAGGNCWSLLVAILLGWPERTWVRTELITIIKLGVALRRCSKSGDFFMCQGLKLLILGMVIPNRESF